MIHFGTGDKQILFQSHLVQADQHGHRQQKLGQATAYYKEIERKLKMISLLKSGGFAAEALPAAQEVFHKGMEILKVLDHSPDTST